MKVAILGTRGVPPRYGGFETFVAELGTRLVACGHEVTVYCRATPDAATSSREQEAPFWNGIRRMVLPAMRGKYFETISHALLSALDAIGRGFDVVLICNAANAFTIPLLRAARLPVAINVDGIERRRRKWNALGRAFYAAGEAFSVSFASRVVADAAVIADYYTEVWGARSVTIPYGAEFPKEIDTDVLTRLGLASRSYVLYVSRFEPENNPLEVVHAYEALSRRGAILPPLVMLGQGLYAAELSRELERHASEAIIFPGALYGGDYRTLQRHALVYVQATEVGGTHPALIEAMGSGGCVLAHDTPENREVGGDTVGYFRLRPTETLSDALAEILRGGWSEEARERARERTRALYGWEIVTRRYEELFESLVSGE